MVHKNSTTEERLRKLIHKIIREELDLIFTKKQVPLDFKSHPNADQLKEKPQKVEESSQQIRHTEPENSPWAIFGSPKPDPDKHFKHERPRALPGWSDPYRPNLSDFEAPPYLPRRISNKIL
jgi:hypothetical protein